MLSLLLLLLPLLHPTPVTALVGGLPVSKATFDTGAISHHVLVESIGGTPDRQHYKSHTQHNVSQHNCTGILLAADYVLLPARCVSDMTTPGEPKLHPSALTVKHSCGIHTPWSVLGRTTCTTIAVEAVFVHPCWRTRVPDEQSNTGSTKLHVLGDHDVAVLRLAGSGVPSIGALQRYAVLDDGATVGNSGGGSSTPLHTNSDVGSVLTFRGYGPIDTQGTKSAAMRETRVQVAPSHQCVDKFDLDIVRRDNGNAGGEDQGGDSRASTSVVQRLSVKSTKSLNFKDRQLCVGNNGLTQYGVTGGCPNGDVGGPLETDDGVLVGLFSRLTPAVPMVDVNHNANEVGADNLDPTHPSRNEEPSNDCGGAGRGRYYDVFTRISYYRGWIQRVVEERYDGGVCSVSRLLDRYVQTFYSNILIPSVSTMNRVKRDGEG